MTPQSSPNDIWAGFPALQGQPAVAVAAPSAGMPSPNQPVPSLSAPIHQPNQPQNLVTNHPAAITTASSTLPAPSTNSTGEQLPWIPLLVVSVSLAGSLAANLFLGWSYADARLRYRNLVRKTTSSFHRAAGAAA
jgi:hypothetical protein